MHLQIPDPIAAAPHQHCVVEVPRRLAVDGHNGQGAKIAPLCRYGRIEPRDFARLLQHRIRKNPRQMMLADHHLHIDAEIVLRAQHLDHAPAGRP